MTEPIVDPRVTRVLLHYREDVAQATERAVQDLRRLGVIEPTPTRAASAGGFKPRRNRVSRIQ